MQKAKSRFLLMLCYLALVVFGFAAPVLMASHAVPPAAKVSYMVMNAFPFILSKFYQDIVQGGAAGGSLLYFVVIAFQLWPLPLLSAFPKVWNSSRVRKVLLGYLGALLAATVGCGIWMLLDPGMLAG